LGSSADRWRARLEKLESGRLLVSRLDLVREKRSGTDSG